MNKIVAFVFGMLIAFGAQAQSHCFAQWDKLWLNETKSNIREVLGTEPVFDRKINIRETDIIEMNYEPSSKLTYCRATWTVSGFTNFEDVKWRLENLVQVGVIKEGTFRAGIDTITGHVQYTITINGRNRYIEVSNEEQWLSLLMVARAAARGN